MTSPTGEPDGLNEILPAVSELEKRLGAKWDSLRKCGSTSLGTWQKLNTALSEACSSDVSVVLFGSIARGEMTAGSDADWVLLIDGQAQPDHLEVARDVGERIAAIVKKQPGREGVFGNLAFSHDLIQLIGGEDDTNKNLTRRNLLLLESKPFGNPDAHQRTLSQIVHRYVTEDLDHQSADREFYVPRFLLNDFARFWRTMAVDFAYKRRGRQSQGLAVRNVKLRMSRKLLFASGLIACFACELGLNEQNCTTSPRQPDANSCRRCLLPWFQNPPLENLARVYLRLASAAPDQPSRAQIESGAREALGAYDQFIGLLDDANKRKSLEALKPEDLNAAHAFAEARAISRQFRDALTKLFFSSDDRLTKLVMKYGVF